MRKITAALLSTLLLAQAVPMSVSAAEAKIETVDGKPTAFISSFGRMKYDGKNYTSYKSVDEALAALGKDGGQLIFSSTLPLSAFADTAGRGKLNFIGIGTKLTSNTLDFTGRETVELAGDTALSFVNIKTDPNAVILTGGYDFIAEEDFDTYSQETYVAGGDNIISYPAPLTIAPGNGAGKGKIRLHAGVYDAVTAGAYSASAAKGTSAQLYNGIYTSVYAGNMAAGKTTGNTEVTMYDGTVDTFYAGSTAGTVDGNVVSVINGGAIDELIVGAANGATINGDLAVVVSGGSVASVKFVNGGKINGSTILVSKDEAAELFADAKGNYVFTVTEGACEPNYENGKLAGFLLTDNNGLPAETATIDGTTVQSATGIYTIAEGTHTVSVPERVLSIRRDAEFVAGYSDGTFHPQNNLSRAEAVTMLARLLADDSEIAKFSSDYTDVAAGTWYSPYIGFFQNLRMLSNIDRDNGSAFAPDEKITRGEFTQLIYEVYSKEKTDSNAMKLKDFSDVKNSNPYRDAIIGSVNAGLVAGYEDGTFRPDGNITRAEVVTMINRLVGRAPIESASASRFSDIESHWAKAQIMAACGKEGSEWSTNEAGGKYVLEGTNYEGYIKGLYNQSASLTGDAILDAVDVISEQMKQDVLNTKDELDLSKRGSTYYISEKNGNDDNDGKTPETALKTITGLQSKVRFLRDANVLFERGGVYRGGINVSTKMTFGAYGEGPKPVWVQSARNYADPELWVETEYPNVWKCTELLINVGVIGFDHDMFDYSDNSYNETYGIIRNYNTDGFMGIEDFDTDLQFFSDTRVGGLNTRSPLYIYSTKGNPGERFSSIEIGERVNIAYIGSSSRDCLFDNISFKFTGAHGICGTFYDVKIQNCVFSWLGGSVLWDGSSDRSHDGSCTCYGNAVEAGICDGYTVENCWCYQIFDTGVTHQQSVGDGNRTQRNIRYTGNLIEYCHWGIEFYNAPTEPSQYINGKDPFTRITEDVIDRYNVVRNTGYGWGSVSKNRMRSSQCYHGSALATNRDQLTEYNIFDRSAGYLLNLVSNSTEVDTKNIYIQDEGNIVGYLKGTWIPECDTSFAANIRKCWGDEEAVVIMIPKK